MVARFVTVQDVRAITGLTSTVISDVDMLSMIEESEFVVESQLNTTFTPRTIIESYQGTNSGRLVLNRNPVLKIRAVKIDDVSVSPQFCRLDKEGGILWLISGAETMTFKTNNANKNLNRIQYDYGNLQPGTTQTTLTTAISTTGNVQTIQVTSSAGLVAGNYISIEGMDSQYEVCKITNVPGVTSLIVDNISTIHENSSVVTLLGLSAVAKRIMKIGCAIECLARAMGGSFEEIASYSLGDMSVTKDQHWTVWKETIGMLSIEWNKLTSNYRIRPAVF